MFRLPFLITTSLLILINSPCNHLYATEYPTAILGAFEEELTWLKGKLDRPDTLTVMGYEFLSGEIEEQPVVLALTGVGKVNAAIMAILIIEHFKPCGVIFTGVAGAIGKDHIPGDVVIADSVVQHDLGDMTPEGLVRFGVRNPLTTIRNPVFFPADEKLLDSAIQSALNMDLERAVLNPEVREPIITLGVIATGDAFITSTPKKVELRDNLDALAVEMEGAAVAQVCYQFEVPCLVIRGMSDFSDENADQDFEKYYQAAARNANRVVIKIIKLLD
jgi:adenosylhomocysteine nucleosidase